MTRLVPVWIEIQSPLAAVESSRSSDAGSRDPLPARKAA
jgi:hypothetical protein